MILSPSIIRKMPLAQKWAGVSGASVDPEPPAAPNVAPVLDAMSIGAGESFATFAWSYSGGDEGTEGFGFEIWVGDELLTTTLLNPYSTSFADGSYTAKVRAVNVSGAGPFSNSEGFTIPGPGEPEAPQGAYLTPDGLSYYVTPDQLSYYQQPE